jgi:hypothetical protein
VLLSAAATPLDGDAAGDDPDCTGGLGELEPGCGSTLRAVDGGAGPDSPVDKPDEYPTFAPRSAEAGAFGDSACATPTPTSLGSAWGDAGAWATPTPTLVAALPPGGAALPLTGGTVCCAAAGGFGFSPSRLTASVFAASGFVGSVFAASVFAAPALPHPLLLRLISPGRILLGRFSTHWI